MSNSMVATPFYVLVVAILATAILRALRRAQRRRRVGGLRAFIQAQRRRRSSSLRAFIEEGAVLAAEGQRQRRRKRVAMVSFGSGERTSTCPWPDRGARDCGGEVACLLDNAVTTPFRPLPQTPVDPMAQPESLAHLTAAHAMRSIAGGDRDTGNITLAEAPRLRAVLVPAAEVAHA